MSAAEKTTTTPVTAIAGYQVVGGGIAKYIAEAPPGQDGGYVIAEVRVVHADECRGRRHGPCTCGAEAAWQAFAERQGDADPFAGIRAEEVRGMTATTTTMTHPPARFEAAWMPDVCGWTVADLMCGTAIAPKQPWDGASAVAVMQALNAWPAYAAMFRWAELDSYPELRWDALVAPLFATSLDGSAQTDLPPGTIFAATTAADGDGLVQISEFQRGDPEGRPCRWLVDADELRAAVGRELLQ